MTTILLTKSQVQTPQELSTTLHRLGIKASVKLAGDKVSVELEDKRFAGITRHIAKKGGFTEALTYEQAMDELFNA